MTTTKITMLQDAQGSDDGIKVRGYIKGQTYEVSNYLAALLVAAGFATEAGKRAEVTGDGESSTAADDDAGDTDGDGTISELEAKTVAELKLIAEAEEVDLGTATKKADIIAAIVAARAEKAAGDTDGDQQ